MTSTWTSRADRRFAPALALVLALGAAGCGDDPTIVLDVGRAQLEFSLSLGVCFPDGTGCISKEIFQPGTGALHRSVAIYVQDQTSPIRFHLQRSLPEGGCTRLDVPVGAERPVQIRVTLADQSTTADCASAGCVSYPTCE
jgi:hypothetical protein